MVFLILLPTVNPIENVQKEDFYCFKFDMKCFGLMEIVLNSKGKGIDYIQTPLGREINIIIKSLKYRLHKTFYKSYSCFEAMKV